MYTHCLEFVYMVNFSNSALSDGIDQTCPNYITTKH